MTLISEIPDPVSLRSLSLSGSDPSRESDLFLRMDFDRLWLSFDSSEKEKQKLNYFHFCTSFETKCKHKQTFYLNSKKMLTD